MLQPALLLLLLLLLPLGERRLPPCGTHLLRYTQEAEACWTANAAPGMP